MDKERIRQGIARLEDARDRLEEAGVPAEKVASLNVMVCELVLMIEDQATCYRCKRTVASAELEPTAEGLFKCSPNGPSYDACMRIYNQV